MLTFQVFNVESAGFLAAIVHNYEGDDSIMSMGGDLSCEYFGNKHPLLHL